MDFLLFIANRWHFLFPPLSGATGGVEEQNNPSSGAAARLTGVPAAWVPQGRDAQSRVGWGHVKLQKTLEDRYISGSVVWLFFYC